MVSCSLNSANVSALPQKCAASPFLEAAAELPTKGVYLCRSWLETLEIDPSRPGVPSECIC